MAPQLAEPPLLTPDEPLVDDAEALFPEARRRQRRRHAAYAAFAAAAIGTAGIAVAITRSGTHPREQARSGSAAGPAPIEDGTSLKVAGPLAVSPDGRLYVADTGRDQILVRLRNGRFRVVVGNGDQGFSGDDGPAVDAELWTVSDLAFGRRGALYIADGGRVRVVTRGGVIRTIAGTGRGTATQLVADRTPALSAPLGSAAARRDDPLSLAVGADGQLYISTGSQVLRLIGGRLQSVHAIARTGPLAGRRLSDFGPIAIDSSGNIDVAGVNGWFVWQIAHGAARQLGRGIDGLARRSGGGYSILERAPDGSVFAEDGPTLVRIDRDRLASAFTFRKNVAGEYFALTYFAFAPNGQIYADEIPAGDSGFEARQQLVSIQGGHVTLLWEQPAPRGRG